MAVKVLAGRSYRIVVLGSAWRAAICTSRRSTPAPGMVVTKVCRSIWGWARPIRTPAVAARRRSRRVAAWRSIRTPRLLSRIGPPPRPSVARSMARPTAGGSGTRTTLPPLPQIRSTRVAVFFAKITDVGAGGFEDPKAQQAEHGHEREAVRIG